MWEKLGFAREHELENGRGNGAEEGVEEFVPATAAFEEGRKDGPTTADDENNKEMDIRMESEDPAPDPSILELCGSCGCLSAMMMIGSSSTEKEKEQVTDGEIVPRQKQEPRMAGNMLMRVNGIFVVMIAACQTFAGLQAYFFKDNVDSGFHFVGAFWVGLWLLMPGVLGIMSTSYTIVMWGFITGVLGFVVAMMGIVSDGSAYSTYVEIKACSHYTNTTATDGEIGIYSYAGESNGCFSKNNNDYECSCIDTSYDCYVFDGGSYNDAMEKNCNAVIQDYPEYLASSYGICVVCVAVIFVYIMFSGASLFCPAYIEKDYVCRIEEEEPKIEEKQQEMMKEVISFYESPTAKVRTSSSS